jgi:seryl-tRNA synthetase
MTVPAIARPQAFVATGHFPGHEEEAYEIPKDELYLAGTGEIALTSLHSGEILEAGALPILYAGYSPCFRREAGSAGRDVRGLLRVHQFYKLEQYVICPDDPEESARWHQRLLANAEGLLRGLEIPYQVIEASTGGQGLGKFRMNDIESWVPRSANTARPQLLDASRLRHAGQTCAGAMASASSVRPHAEQYGTGVAANSGPLLENHQQADGRVRLPAAAARPAGR